MFTGSCALLNSKGQGRSTRGQKFGWKEKEESDERAYRSLFEPTFSGRVLVGLDSYAHYATDNS